jgi:hypothetical protein
MQSIFLINYGSSLEIDWSRKRFDCSCWSWCWNWDCVWLFDSKLESQSIDGKTIGRLRSIGILVGRIHLVVYSTGSFFDLVWLIFFLFNNLVCILTFLIIQATGWLATNCSLPL